MKKRISIFLLALLLLPCIFIFTACGNKDNNSYSQKFSITFIVDEEIYSKIETGGNEYIQLPTSPTKNGYTFVGWFFDNNIYKTELKANTYANTTLSSNVNVFAKFTQVENAIFAESISLDKTQLNITIGETYSLSATILPNDTANKNITWSSSNQNVATVIDGKITTISVGQTTIKAQTSNGKFTTCEVKVIDVGESVQIDVYIDNQKVNTLATNSAMSYKITAPTKPEDITVNPNSEKYFYGWFVDSNYQTPLTDNTVFTSNGKIYAKWTNVYSKDFVYSVSKGKATITSFKNSNNLTDIVIPCFINSFPVEKIGEYAFKNQLLRNVIICNGIKNIETNAFDGCSLLENIIIPDSITSIGEGAFSGCSRLTSITIPDSVISIGRSAFYSCKSLTSLTISDSVKSIGEYAFAWCEGLASITIPDNVTSIGHNVFSGCKKLNNIVDNLIYIKTTTNDYYYLIGTTTNTLTTATINKSCKFIDSFAFLGCDNLITLKVEEGNEKYNSVGDCIIDTVNKILVVGSNTSIIPNDESVTSIGDSAFSDCSSLTSIIIPNGVTCIGERSFSNCSNLTSITIPNSITNIGAWAFSDCRRLTSITIPNSVTSIGDSAFSYCSALREIHISSLESWFSIDFGHITSNPIYYAHHLYLNGEELIEIAIPNSITEIKNYALYVASSIKSITIPNSVIRIGKYAFYGCDNLITLNVEEGNEVYHSAGNCIIDTINKTLVVGCNTSNIPNDGSITSIGDSAFSDCSSLTSIIIPNGVTSIGERSFSNCRNLTSITIPNSVISIGEYAFSSCSSLKSIIIPNGVTSIGDSAFSNCCNLTSITIPNSVISIGEYAFSSCSSLKSIIIPNGVISIGDSAFSNCSSLTSVVIESGVTNIYIGKYVFNASKIKEVHISSLESWFNIDFGHITSNPIYYAHHLFLNGEELTEITIPNSITKIKNYALYGASSIKSITIPNSVTSIGDSAFADCYGLVEIYNLSKLNIKKGLSDYGCVGYYAREIYTSLTQQSKLKKIKNIIYYIDGKEKIAITAIDKNTTDIVIDNDCTEINQRAFYHCSNLTSITIPNGVTSIGEYAFSDCSSLTSIIIPNGVTSIGERSFSNCSNLTSITLPNSVISIGEYAFYSCKSLTSLTISNSVISIGRSAFYSCKSLTSLTISDSVKSIGEYAFAWCEGLASITIPDSVTSIGHNAFLGCRKLNNIVDNLIYIKTTTNDYYYLIGTTTNTLTTATINKSCNFIDSSAFRDCDNLITLKVEEGNEKYNSVGDCIIDEVNKILVVGSNTSIIPNDGSVISIGDSAFSDCRSLTSIIIPNGVTSIGERSFSNCSNLTSIIIPNSVTSIGSSAFSGDVNIYCENTFKPSDWAIDWNSSECSVYWYSETEATETGNFWHYVDGVVTKW